MLYSMIPSFDAVIVVQFVSEFEFQNRSFQRHDISDMTAATRVVVGLFNS